MTGFGEARRQTENLSVSVEVRTVNNRYLKVAIRCPDAYATLEGEIEKIVREKISRGTVTVGIRVEHAISSQENPLNETVLENYVSRLKSFADRLNLSHEPDLNVLVTLPGVVTDDSRRAHDADAEWPIIQDVIRQGLEKLQKFRQDEGQAMQNELQLNGRIIEAQLVQVTDMAPQVVSEYRSKLLERVRQVLTESAVNVTESDMIREVSIHADRTDINEEIKRLRCHLEQFQTFIDEKEPTGRKLDFLSQEMFREVNTIGSKANNVPIAHCVVEMKAAVEKIREILQNVE
ncbi:MAG: hypothetical protein JWM11_7695 [Planctomycetaceae bacterium]|nr:hypothetical protein [Planctomycetaceae bacterium]